MGVVTVQQRDVPVYGDWVATLDGYVNANIQPQVSGYLLSRTIAKARSFTRTTCCSKSIRARFRRRSIRPTGNWRRRRGQACAGAGATAARRNQRKARYAARPARAIAQSQLDNDIQTRAAAAQSRRSKPTQAAIQSAEAAVETAQLNLGFTKVRSLIDGIAGIATTQIGNLVSPTTVLTTVSQVNPIKVYFPISEQEYLTLAGRMQSATAPDLLRAKQSGSAADDSVEREDLSAHKGASSLPIARWTRRPAPFGWSATFANPGNVLRPGQFGRIRAMTGINRTALAGAADAP